MQVAQQAVGTVKEQRSEAIAETMARVRAIEREHGVTREALQAMRAEVERLGLRKKLFPAADFPPEANEQGFFPVYRLSEDEDHRFAMYMSASIGSKDVPPHDHTTWAVIAGVQGEEENRFYERTDDGSREGKAQVRQVGGDTVRPGHGVTLMPEDIHSIHPRNDVPALHLHVYGRALDHLPNRVTYNMDKGTVKVFPASPNIIEAR